MKTCPKCGKELPVTEFYKNRTRKDELSAWCKDCINQEARRWYAENHERELERGAKYRREHAEEVREKSARYYAENREKAVASQMRWRRAHPAAARAAKHRYRGKLSGAEGTHSAKDIQNILDAQGGKCYYCGEPLLDGWDVDHKTPLCRGGSSWPENLAIACPFCNASKGKRTEEEYIAGIARRQHV